MLFTLLVAGAQGQQHQHGHSDSSCRENKHPLYAHDCAACVAHTQKSCTKCEAAGFDCHCTCGWPGDMIEEGVDQLADAAAEAELSNAKPTKMSSHSHSTTKGWH